MFSAFQWRVAFDIHSIRMSWLVFEVQLLMHINNEYFMDYERIIFVKWNFMLCLFFHIFKFLLASNRLIIDNFVYRFLFEACAGKCRMEIFKLEMYHGDSPVYILTWYFSKNLNSLLYVWKLTPSRCLLNICHNSRWVCIQYIHAG